MEERKFKILIESRVLNKENPLGSLFTNTVVKKKT